MRHLSRRSPWLLLAMLHFGVTLPVMAEGIADRPSAGPIKIAVVDLRADGVTPELADTLTSLLAGELTRLHVFLVVSNQEIRAMMTHDAMLQLAGCEGTTKCNSNMIGALGAQYLVSGNVGNVGSVYTLNFVLTNVQTGTVDGRTTVTVDNPVKLLDAATRSSQTLVSKVLSSRQTTMLVSCSERGAAVKLDGEIVGTTPLGKFPVSWGPHLIEVSKTGFVTGTEDVTVQRSEVNRSFLLIPSPDFVNEYQAKARRMRLGAWTTTGAAVVSVAGALSFQFYHTRIANDFLSLRTQYEATVSPSESAYLHLAMLHNQATSAIDATYALTGLGVALAGAAFYFWVAGDDPGKYASYREAEAGAPHPAAVSFHVLDGSGLASIRW